MGGLHIIARRLCALLVSISGCAGAPPSDQQQIAPVQPSVNATPSDAAAGTDALSVPRPEPVASVRAPAAGVPGDLSILCTVLEMSVSSLSQSDLDWVVTCRVEEIRLGTLPSAKFVFRIHSPTKSGLVKGGRYEVFAKRQEDSYLVDPYQGIKPVAGAASDAWTQNESPDTVAPDDETMPRDLIAENIRSMPYTAVVRITAARVDDPHGLRSGYVNHLYRAHVLETIQGEHLNDIEYAVMADRDVPLSMPSYPLIVSLCGSRETGFYVPDNGYISTAPEDLIRFARSVRATKTRSISPSPVCR